MQIEETPRGYPIGNFSDVHGNMCSIQDSSLASEAAMWLGVVKNVDGEDVLGSRMHMSQGMATHLHRCLEDHQHDKDVPMREFEDLNGNTYLIQSLDDTDIIEVGVIETHDEQPGITMMLTRDAVRDLMPRIAGFADRGSIAQEAEADWNKAKPVPVLDVKIPESMLGRADVAETGVSAQELIDALCDIESMHSFDGLKAVLGHDRAVRIVALKRRLQPYWRNADGTHAIHR